MQLPKPIRKAFKDHGIQLDKYGLAKTKHFNILIHEKNDSGLFLDGGRRWVIRFGYKPTFDRWANSSNFETEIWYNPQKNQRYQVGEGKGQRRPQYRIPNLSKELAWCLKCAKSGVFNFNSYYDTIKTPWFIHD
jgi:hypothetical protein